MHVVSDSGAGSATGEWTWAAVFGLTALITAGEVVYSQTMACVVDEGYHLLAAQLILLGKRPYLDFVFPQTPLNAYWNALWMGILGQSWRPIHLIAALETMAAVYITADFVLRRFPFAGWRLAAALTTVVVFGLNDAVFKFGAVAQPYGICLLLSAASLRSAVAAVERESRWLAALAGACAAGAAASSLLTAPVVPVLLVWTWFYSTPARRLGSCLSLLGGAVVPFLPSVWLLLHGPEQVIFGTIAYQLLYRRLDWPGAIDHDAGVMLSWVDSGQALILIVLSLGALGFVRSRKDWTRLQRAPFYLCGWMALALAFHISQAHPTFAWYYLLMLPFLGVLAPLGLYALGSKLGYADRPFMALLPVAVLGVLGLAKSVHAEWGYIRWSSYEELAARVDAVSAPQTRIFADEQIYFLTRRMPPEGQEIEDSHKMILPAQKAALLHIVPRADAYRHIKEGYFGTVVMCDDDAINDLDLAHRFSHQESFEDLDCTLFWQLAPLKTATAGAT